MYREATRVEGLGLRPFSALETHALVLCHGQFIKEYFLLKEGKGMIKRAFGVKEEGSGETPFLIITDLEAFSSNK